MLHRSPWQEVAHQVQRHRDYTVSQVRPRIPDVPFPLPRNVIAIPQALLSTREFQITATCAEDLVASLATGSLTSTEVTNSFLRRAGLAQKLANCGTELLPDRALARAQELDKYFAEYKKPRGPLHGLPISVKEHVGMKGLGLNAGLVAWADKRQMRMPFCWRSYGKLDASFMFARRSHKP